MRTVLLVTNIPSPYRIPLFNEINRQLIERGMELYVVFGNRTYSRRKFDPADESEFKFRYQFLGSGTLNFGNEERTYFSYKGLFRIIKEQRPACIIMNGFTIASTLLRIRSIISSVPYIIWSGSVMKKGRNDSIIRKIQRRFIISGACAFIAYGKKAADYLVHMGAEQTNVFIGINTVDTEFFRKNTTFSLPKKGAFNLIYVGYLSARKNVARLFDIVADLKSKGRNCHLNLVGDGPEKIALERRAEELSLSEQITFYGFRQKEELPEILSMSHCFLFQTDFDIWGLVLNETMAAGIPVIASAEAGAVHDLITNGENGYIADFTRPSEIAQIVAGLMDDHVHLKELSNNASDTILEKATIEISGRGFVDAVVNCTK
jgi:glycosyltransferase involved in cell wall biosynthesis